MNWISVNDSLPGCFEPVLTVQSDGFISIISLCQHKRFKSQYAVTHWMPLPTPPPLGCF